MRVDPNSNNVGMTGTDSTTDLELDQYPDDKDRWKDDQTEPPANETGNENEGSSGLMIALISLVIFLLVIGIIIFFITRKMRSSPAETLGERDVYICYDQSDKNVADAICHHLEEKKIRCWIAPRDVIPGQNVGKAIVEAIESVKIMVLIFSSKSNSSKGVIREVERSVSKGVVILPIKIENVIPSKDLEYYISSSHWLDAVTPHIDTHLSNSY